MDEIVIDLQGFSEDEIIEQVVGDILSVSILKGDSKPSNRLPVEIKGRTKGEQPTQLIAKVDSIDKKKGIIYSTPMIANIVDTDKDFYSNKNVKDVAHKTLKTKTMTYISDINHDYNLRDDITIVESYVDESDSSHHAWKIAQDVSKNEELMADLDSITGVSIWAFMTPVDKSKKKKIKFFSTFKKTETKGETADTFQAKEIIVTIENAVYTFERSVIEWNENLGRVLKVKTQEEFDEEVKDLNDILNGIDIITKTKGFKVEKKELLEMLKDDEVRKEVKSIIVDIEENGDDTKTEEEKAKAKAEAEAKAKAKKDAEDGKEDDETAKTIKELKDLAEKQDKRIKELELGRQTDSKPTNLEKDYRYYQDHTDEWEALEKSEQKAILKKHALKKK